MGEEGGSRLERAERGLLLFMVLEFADHCGRGCIRGVKRGLFESTSIEPLKVLLDLF